MRTAQRRSVEGDRSAARPDRCGDALAIVVLDRQRRREVTKRVLLAALMRAAEALDLRGKELTVVLGGDRLLRALNARYRNQDVATDVLSFATETDRELGDVVVNVQTAQRQARAHGHALQEQLATLAVHGLLHLLGYDHATDGGRMRRLEARLRHSRRPRGARGGGRRVRRGARLRQ